MSPGCVLLFVAGCALAWTVGIKMVIEVALPLSAFAGGDLGVTFGARLSNHRLF